MEKYRVRLKTGRVVGPFLENQVIEMRDKGFISGDEECQVYPTGDWLAVKTFSFWVNDSKSINPEATFVIDLAQLKDAQGPKNENIKAKEFNPESSLVNVDTEPLENPKHNKTQFREFDYKNAIEEIVDEPIPIPQKKVPTQTPKIDKSEKTIIRSLPTEDESERTVVRPLSSGKQAEDFDKTVVKTEAIKWKNEQEIEKQKKEELRKKIEIENKLREEEEKKNTFNLDTDSTQAISLSGLKGELHEEAVRSEHELIQIEEIVQTNKRKQQEKKESEERKDEEEDTKSQEIEVQKEKRKKIFLVLAILVVIAFLFPENKKEEKKAAVFVPLEPVIEFPVPFDMRDDQKFKTLTSTAFDKSKSGTYPDKVEAAKAFRLAYENNSSEKKTLTRMIRTYSELLPHSISFERDGGIVFKLMQAHRVLQDIDPDMALAAGLFYRSIEKKSAAHEVLDRFVRSGANNPTRELFAELLNSLVDQNIETKADEVASSLLKTSNRGIEVNLALINYYRYKNYPEKAKGIVEESLKEKPDSVPLLIAKGEFYLEEVNMKGLAEIYKKIGDLKAEQSKLYYGKLLEFKGFLLAFQNKPAEDRTGI